MPELPEILKEGIVKVRYSGSGSGPLPRQINFSLAGKAGSAQSR